MYRQVDIDWVMKDRKEPLQRCIKDGQVVEKFVGEVEHANVKHICEILPDWIHDSAEERRAVHIASNIHEYLPGDIIQHRVCYIEQVLRDIVSEISENQANV